MLQLPRARFGPEAISVHSNRSRWVPPLLFVGFGLWSEWQNAHVRIREPAPLHVSRIAARSAAIEIVKLLLSLVYSLWRRMSARTYQRASQDDPDEEEYPTGDELARHHNSHAHGNHDRAEAPVHNSAFGGASIAYLSLAAALFAFGQYNAAIARQVTDPFTLFLTFSCATLCTLFVSHLILAQSFSAIQWHSALLQSCGFLVIQAGVISQLSPHPSYPMLIGSVLSDALSYVLLKYLYSTHGSSSVHVMHSTLFASGIMIHSIVLLISQVDQPSGAIWAKFDPLMPQPWAAYFLQAAASLSALAVTYYWDAATKGVLASTSAAVCILLVGLSSGKTLFVLVGGCLLTISASFLYLAHHTDIEDDARHGKRAAIPFRRLVSAVLLVSSLFYLVLGASHEWGRVLDHSEKPATVSEVLDEATASCHRRPLASLKYWPVERTYHAFDNVLLIVFFSHARYDANLDYYKEVYSQFFPNIVFVGPGSREDKGFAHSYDVVVDSYQSDEDLNDPTFYKMAGRMAHHMLFTVMRENDCYDGYLWAPFDTLLNVPRLQQFDQNLFWYHSPFGQYVPNPAFSDTTANMNKSRHAPPANLSPDPTVDLTATWRGWGPDWWWGDPHVGLAVCMQAFGRVPQALRDNLALRTTRNGTARLVGGSADTLYIPGRHRAAFMDTLGLFLETDCFLEIATPTTVHLVAPTEEPILFVDHWWIWQPPFNASFVRQIWAAGMEVDTFHTFHWGDRGADGVWRGNFDHIADVRSLLVESAQRQGVEWPV